MRGRIVRALARPSVALGTTIGIGAFSIFMHRKKKEFSEAQHELDCVNAKLEVHTPKPKSAEELAREHKHEKFIKEHLKQHPSDAFFIGASSMGVFARETRRVADLTDQKAELEEQINRNPYGKLANLSRRLTGGRW